MYQKHAVFQSKVDRSSILQAALRQSYSPGPATYINADTPSPSSIPCSAVWTRSQQPRFNDSLFGSSKMAVDSEPSVATFLGNSHISIHQSSLLEHQHGMNNGLTSPLSLALTLTG